MIAGIVTISAGTWAMLRTSVMGASTPAPGTPAIRSTTPHRPRRHAVGAAPNAPAPPAPPRLAVGHHDAGDDERREELEQRQADAGDDRQGLPGQLADLRVTALGQGRALGML